MAVLRFPEKRYACYSVSNCRGSQCIQKNNVKIPQKTLEIDGSQSRPKRTLTPSQKGLQSLELPTDSDS